MTPPGSPLEVFLAFLRLGLTSFGGPVAHLGYFREDIVLRRRWLDEAAYADLVALCQFLPGPASSQVGFALGVLRAGWLGGIAAWTAFTLPSALAMLAFAFGAAAIAGPTGDAVLHGLKLVAVAIVAQAIWGMARSLCPDRTRAAIALAALAIVALAGNAAFQLAAIALGALAGLLFTGRAAPAATASLTAIQVTRPTGTLLLALFALLLLLPPLLLALGASFPGLALFEAFYRAGALVFGGGHVVLPLLQQAVVAPGWMTADVFLAGYGAAQAMPGPLFTFAAYLGAAVTPAPNGVAGAIIALLGVSIPGLLLVAGALPWWDRFRTAPTAQAAMRGANAAVVGVLAAAFHHPVWTSAVLAPPDFAIAATGFMLLVLWRMPPLAVVALTVLAAILAAALPA